MRSLLTIAFISISVNLLGQSIDGVYMNDEMENLKLYLSEDLFLYGDDSGLEHLALYQCSDTIAFGYWEKDADVKSLIRLYTNPLQLASLVESKIQENEADNRDSIYFRISNPIEDQYIYYNSVNPSGRIIYYTISIETNKQIFDQQVNLERFHSNKVSIYVPEGTMVKSFEITAHPTCYSNGWKPNMSPNYVTTLRYNVENLKSNSFQISIPELTVCYLSTLRLDGDFVKILSKKQLEWDGYTYTKMK